MTGARKKRATPADLLRAYAAFVPTLARYADATAAEAFDRQARELDSLVLRHAELAGAAADGATAEMHRRAGADAALKARLCRLLAGGSELESAITVATGAGAGVAGQLKRPRRDASFWRAAAADLGRSISYKTKNPYPGRRLTAARRRDWQFRLDQAHEDLCWQGTLDRLAASAEAGALPAILFGLTNANQIRNLMRYAPSGYQDATGPHNMGPTIRTVEQLREAAAALKPFVFDAPKLYVPVAGDDAALSPGASVTPREDSAPLLRAA
jgi:hypothetical protein